VLAFRIASDGIYTVVCSVAGGGRHTVVAVKHEQNSTVCTLRCELSHVDQEVTVYRLRCSLSHGVYLRQTLHYDRITGLSGTVATSTPPSTPHISHVLGGGGVCVLHTSERRESCM
jgi:hypothetical protein